MEEINFLAKAEEIKDLLIEYRRDFHRNPELGFEEHRTSDTIKEFLDNEGIEYFETAGTGICALIKGKEGRTVAIRADMDALPIQDMKTCEYSSRNAGKMHACGHDAHTAILMGAAKILNGMKDSLVGNVVLLFEPAEETTGGARIMIKEGVLEKPYVEAVIGLHVDENIDSGMVGVKKGVVNAASNPFTIRIKGKGGHGARPEATVDPVVIASSVVMNLQTIVSRELTPTVPAVLTIGTINGGTAQNIIPEEVVLSGIIRTMTTEHREYVKMRLREIAEGVTLSLRGTCQVDIEESYPCLYNDDGMLELLKESAGEQLGEENVIDLSDPSLGVESFAYFSMERPSVFYFLGCRNEDKGITHPAHSNKFDIDEDCLAAGVAVHCAAAYKYLNDKEK
ncbi:MAG TPA: amidohydrolase [Clostridiaceae bacterium]|nr:amidohydrolase [Clostridiaceae bacterium]